MKRMFLMSLGLFFCGCPQTAQLSAESTILASFWFAGPTGPEGPRGEKGDQGQRGPRGLPGTTFVSSYAYATINVNDTTSPFSNGRILFTKPSENALYNASWDEENNALQIIQPGVYEISCYARCLSDETTNTSLQASIIQNSVSPSAISFVSSFHPTSLSPYMEECILQGSAILRLGYGDTIQVELKKTNDECSTPLRWNSDGMAASMLVKRIAD